MSGFGSEHQQQRRVTHLPSSPPVFYYRVRDGPEWELCRRLFESLTTVAHPAIQGYLQGFDVDQMRRPEHITEVPCIEIDGRPAFGGEAAAGFIAGLSMGAELGEAVATHRAREMIAAAQQQQQQQQARSSGIIAGGSDAAGGGVGSGGVSTGSITVRAADGNSGGANIGAATNGAPHSSSNGHGPRAQVKISNDKGLTPEEKEKMDRLNKAWKQGAPPQAASGAI